VEKTYQLKLEECLEANGQKVLARRTVAPSLVMIGLGTMAFWILLLLIGVDAYKVPRLQILTAMSACLALIGVFLWKWEGQRSIRIQTALYERKYSERMKPGIFKLNENGWSVTHEGAEDFRNPASLRSLSETANTITLVSDVYHLLPKRVFEPLALQKLLSLISCNPPTPTSQEQASGVLLSPWDFVTAAFEYYRWRRPGYLLAFLAMPPVALSIAILNARLSPFDANTSALPYEVRFILIAGVVWYLTLPLYHTIHALLKHRGATLDSLDQTGFAFRMGANQAHIGGSGPSSDVKAGDAFCWKWSEDISPFPNAYLAPRNWG